MDLIFKCVHEGTVFFQMLDGGAEQAEVLILSSLLKVVAFNVG